MIEFLYQALNSKFGAAIQTSDVEKLRQDLYKIRREVADPDLDGLSLIPSPIAEDELWIVKRLKEKQPDFNLEVIVPDAPTRR